MNIYNWNYFLPCILQPNFKYSTSLAGSSDVQALQGLVQVSFSPPTVPAPNWQIHTLRHLFPHSLLLRLNPTNSTLIHLITCCFPPLLFSFTDRSNPHFGSSRNCNLPDSSSHLPLRNWISPHVLLNIGGTAPCAVKPLNTPLCFAHLLVVELVASSSSFGDTCTSSSTIFYLYSCGSICSNKSFIRIEPSSKFRIKWNQLDLVFSGTNFRINISILCKHSLLK